MFITINTEHRIVSHTHGWRIQRLNDHTWATLADLGSPATVDARLRRTDRAALAPGGLPVPGALTHLIDVLSELAAHINGLPLPAPNPTPSFAWSIGLWSITADRRQFVVRNDNGRPRTYHRHLIDALRHLVAERVRLIEGEFPICLPALDALREELTDAAAHLPLTTPSI